MLSVPSVLIIPTTYGVVVSALRDDNWGSDGASVQHE